MKIKKVCVLSVEEAKMLVARDVTEDLVQNPSKLISKLMGNGIQGLQYKDINDVIQEIVDRDLGEDLAKETKTEAVAIEVGAPEAVHCSMDHLNVIWVEPEEGEKEYCSSCRGEHGKTPCPGEYPAN